MINRSEIQVQDKDLENAINLICDTLEENKVDKVVGAVAMATLLQALKEEGVEVCCQVVAEQDPD